MQLIKKIWTKKDYEDLYVYLENKKDINYKIFTEKIVLDNTIIGVRMPILKKIAKEIHKGNYKSYLDKKINNTYEEKLLYGLVICNIVEFNSDTKYYLENYEKMINNWALCDLFCSNFKIVKKNKKEVLEYILNKIKSSNQWDKRLAFVLLLNYYIEKQYLDIIFELCDTYNTNDYYVKMSVSWLLSMCYVKYKNETMNYLKSNKLDDFTYNKALQKIIESKRITKEEKDIIRKMKRGEKNENRNSK